MTRIASVSYPSANQRQSTRSPSQVEMTVQIEAHLISLMLLGCRELAGNQKQATCDNLQMHADRQGGF